MLSDNTSSYVFSHPDSILRFIRQETHKHFTLERADILTQLDIAYKRKFGQIVCCSSNVNAIVPFPVLVVSPFDVPPGEIRLKWMQAFLKHRQDKSMHCLPHLVYLYGNGGGGGGGGSTKQSKVKSANESYCLVDPSDLVPYNDDWKKVIEEQYHQSSSKEIACNFDRFEQIKLEINIDLAKKKDNRKGPFFIKFLEAFHLVTLKFQPFEEVEKTAAANPGVHVLKLNDDKSLGCSLQVCDDHLEEEKDAGATLFKGMRVQFWPKHACGVERTAFVLEKRQGFVLLSVEDTSRGSEEIHIWLPLSDYEYTIVDKNLADRQENNKPTTTIVDYDTLTTCEGTILSSSSAASCTSTSSSLKRDVPNFDPDEEDDGEGHDLPSPSESIVLVHTSEASNVSVPLSLSPDSTSSSLLRVLTPTEEDSQTPGPILRHTLPAIVVSTENECMIPQNSTTCQFFTALPTDDDLLSEKDKDITLVHGGDAKRPIDYSTLAAVQASEFDSDWKKKFSSTLETNQLRPAKLVKRSRAFSTMRLTEEGFLRPKVELKQRRDGTFVAPKGRPPLGTYFHNVLGVFIPKVDPGSYHDKTFIDSMEIPSQITPKKRQYNSTLEFENKKQRPLVTDTTN